MKLRFRHVLVTAVSCGLAVTVSLAKMNADSRVSVTNLAEILPYVQAFSSNLDLDTPRILTTNDVTKFTGYRPKLGYGREIVSLDVGRFHFTFDVENLSICLFTDERYSKVALQGPEKLRPLNESQKVTQEQALEMARNYLARLGYSEKDLPVLSPKVEEFKWQPPGATKPGLLFFTVEWPWSKYPDWPYFTIEIDGLREKVTYFSTTYPRQDPPAKQ